MSAALLSSAKARFDRSQTRRALRSGVLSARGRRARVANGVHILAGHHMGATEIRDREVFRDLLRHLAKQARLVNIESASRLIAQEQEVDEPMIAFTFDDGFRDCYSHLAPTLEEFGINAALFINPGYVGADAQYVESFNRSVVDLPGKLPMTRDMVSDLAGRGFVIGAHTIDHADLTSSDEDLLKHQIVDCKSAVEEISGTTCDWFAWPYGTYRHISSVALELALDTYDVVFSSDNYPQYSSHGGRVQNRRHFEVDWPQSHVRYFLGQGRSFGA